MTDAALVRTQATALVHETGRRAALIGGAVGLLWLITIVDRVLLGGALAGFGIHPRSLLGLGGVLIAPFVHAGFGHLIANTLPFAVLGFLATSRKRLDFWIVSVVSTLSAGLGAWLLGGAGTVHIGASGVIFGYLGFLMGRGLFERRVGTFVLSLFVTLLFGGMLFTMLPFVAAGVSWQAHLFGWLGGLWVSRLLGRELQRQGGRRARS